MKIENLMSKNAVCIHEDERLSLAKTLFEEHRFHHILVIDNTKKLVGVLSDRDLFKAISPNIGSASERERDLATLNKRVHQVASRTAIAIKSSASLNDAITLFRENRISCIPVTDEHNKPIGILSWRDIINWLYTKLNK